MSFASPYLLLTLLLVPLAAAFGILVRRRRARYPVNFTNLDVLAGVVQSDRRRSLRWLIPLALLLFGLALAGTALARPETKTTVVEQHSVVVMLVDVSGSMQATDIEPDRLVAAVSAMQDFINRLPAEAEIGLVEFSTQPEIIALPTTDHERVLSALSYLSPNGATALGDGLSTAISVTRRSSAGIVVHQRGGVDGAPGAVVLLSDGAQNRGTVQPLEAARRAKGADIPVYTIAFGTPQGKESIPGFSQPVPVPPDPQTMDAIARITGARTFTAKTAAQTTSVYNHLGSVLGRRQEQRSLAPWFAALAAVFLIGAALAARVFGPALT